MNDIIGLGNIDKGYSFVYFDYLKRETDELFSLLDDTFQSRNSYGRDKYKVGNEDSSFKELDYGIENAGKVVEISFEALFYGRWEDGSNKSSIDYFSVSQGDNVIEFFTHNGKTDFSKDYSLNIQLDDKGQAEIKFNASTTKSDEYVDIQNIVFSEPFDSEVMVETPVLVELFGDEIIGLGSNFKGYERVHFDHFNNPENGLYNLLDKVVLDSYGSSRDNYKIGVTEVSSQEFDFGKEYAGKTVSIDFDVYFNGTWENGYSHTTVDFFMVSSGGEVLEFFTHKGPTNFGQEYSFLIELDENGRAVVDFQASTSKTNESVDIGNIVATVVSSPYEGMEKVDDNDLIFKSEVVTVINSEYEKDLYTLGDERNSYTYIREDSELYSRIDDVFLSENDFSKEKYRVGEPETITKEFDFGVENAGRMVNLDFDIRVNGNWENGYNGSVVDFFTYSINGNMGEFFTHKGKTDFVNEYHSLAVIDDSGKVSLTFEVYTNKESENIEIGNLVAHYQSDEVISVVDSDAMVQAGYTEYQGDWYRTSNPNLIDANDYQEGEPIGIYFNEEPVVIENFDLETDTIDVLDVFEEDEYSLLYDYDEESNSTEIKVGNREDEEFLTIVLLDTEIKDSVEFNKVMEDVYWE